MRTDIIIHSSFMPWINCTGLVRINDKIFANAMTLEWKKNVPWLKWTQDSQIKWESALVDWYMGLNDDTFRFGPSAKIEQISQSVKSLTDINILAFYHGRFGRSAQRRRRTMSTRTTSLR